MTSRAAIKRIAFREYVPLVALVFIWLGIAAAAGHADAVRLLAAVTIVRAARSLTMPAVLVPLRARIRSGMHAAQARRTALWVEAAAYAGSLIAIAALAALLAAAGQNETMLLCLLFSLALPVRSLMPLAAGRFFGNAHRLTLGIVGLALVAGGWAAGAGITTFALLLAAREWIALPVALAFTRRVRPKKASVDKLGWREIAARSYRLGRKRAAYRFSKTFLHAAFGPVGSFAARTGRGMRLDRKVERFVPQQPAALAAVAVAGTAAGTMMILYFPEPALLVIAASLFRMAAASANVLIWGKLSGWGTGPAVSEDVDEEDD